MKSASNPHTGERNLRTESGQHDTWQCPSIQAAASLLTKGFSLSFLLAAFLTSFALVLLETHCFVRQAGAASLFVMLQRAGFLLVAVARACSSWALPSPGLRKKRFSSFEGFFPRIPTQLCMMTFSTSPVTTKQMYLGAFPSTGTNWHRNSFLHAIELLHLPEKWLCAICPVGQAQWHRLSPRLGLGTSWDDRSWLGAKLG